MNYYMRLLYRVFQEEVLAIPGRVIALVFLAVLFVLPVFTTHPYVLRVLTVAAIFAIFASSWDMLAGVAGQLNLGQALFFGISAYTVAFLNIHLELPSYMTIPAGAIIAVGMGFIVGLPALRLRGFYLALVTLAFPIILTDIIFMFPNFTGGELGISGLDSLSSSKIYDYYIVLLIMVASVTAMLKFSDVEAKMIRTGVVLHAIREDEITARASGINTTWYKLLAFAVSGFFAGISGGLYAHFMRITGPSTLELFFSFQAILWTIFGGIGTIYGGVAGVYLLYPLMEYLSLFDFGESIRFILFAVILIITLLFMPEGLASWVRDKIELECPRCKLVNSVTRRTCRACRAPLRLERNLDEKREGA